MVNLINSATVHSADPTQPGTSAAPPQIEVSKNRVRAAYLEMHGTELTIDTNLEPSRTPPSSCTPANATPFTPPFPTSFEEAEKCKERRRQQNADNTASLKSKLKAWVKWITGTREVK
jgi:hypothetical protein